MKYKYKKQIATGAIALSLLIGGSSVFAATPQDLGIKPNSVKNSQAYPKQKKQTIKAKIPSNVVGTVASISDTGFIVDVKNMKTKVTSSVDVIASSTTVYTKDGAKATSLDLAVGQKVIVVGQVDKTTNIITASKVKIVTAKVVAPKVIKKVKSLPPVKTN